MADAAKAPVTNSRRFMVVSLLRRRVRDIRHNQVVDLAHCRMPVDRRIAPFQLRTFHDSGDIAQQDGAFKGRAHDGGDFALAGAAPLRQKSLRPAGTGLLCRRVTDRAVL